VRLLPLVFNIAGPSKRSEDPSAGRANRAQGWILGPPATAALQRGSRFQSLSTSSKERQGLDEGRAGLLQTTVPVGWHGALQAANAVEQSALSQGR